MVERKDGQMECRTRKISFIYFGGLKWSLVFWLPALILLHSCSPKVSPPEEVVTEVPPPMPEEGLSDCTKFQDISNGSDMEDNYIIYRDFIKLNKFDESFELWQKVYKNAPAADGRRWTVYSDGVRYYEHFLKSEEDSLKRHEYIETIFTLYDEIGRCYPDQLTYVQARKAFDLYYQYPHLADERQKYELFKSVVDEKQMDTYVYVINPFTKLMVDHFLRGDIDTTEARAYSRLIPKIVEKGLLSGEDQKAWVTVDEYAIPYIENLEAVKGFFPCEYFKEKYLSLFQVENKSCEEVTQYYSKIRFGGCDKNDPDIAAMYAWLENNNCIEALPSADPCSANVSSAYDALREGQYQKAVALFEQAIDCSTSDKNKGTYHLLIAKVYYSHLKNFPQSRTYARRAAAFRPDWGEPHILIGKLYASSGPLCGPGRGFDSQVVTWPAIDQWLRARSIDPESVAEANQLIGRYTQYMPSKEDIFLRNMKEGDSYHVGCWIQESTQVRTP